MTSSSNAFDGFVKSILRFPSNVLPILHHHVPVGAPLPPLPKSVLPDGVKPALRDYCYILEGYNNQKGDVAVEGGVVDDDWGGQEKMDGMIAFCTNLLIIAGPECGAAFFSVWYTGGTGGTDHASTALGIECCLLGRDVVLRDVPNMNGATVLRVPPAPRPPAAAPPRLDDRATRLRGASAARPVATDAGGGVRG
eukprot:gene8305-19879_t